MAIKKKVQENNVIIIDDKCMRKQLKGEDHSWKNNILD